MKNLVLIGFMGTGKTAIGRMLARQMGMKFVDTDDVISTRYGMSISDIFERFGEPEFRKAEREAIAEVCAAGPQVIATGGGAVENEENLANLRKNAVVVCLTADVEVILQRTSARDSRPMLRSDGDRVSRILELLARRRPFYACADLEIDTSANDPESAVQEIVSYYREHEKS